ncbi:MAG: transporter [Candidatus Omnitrophica bacterium]|nr:transporter [Candidatus Omnitrophota bacterium]
MRKARKGASVFFLTVGMVGAFLPDLFAAEWVSDSGVSVSTGDYGTGEDTTVTQLSQTFKRRGQTGEVGLVIPYLFRDGGGVTAGETARAGGGAIPEEASGVGDLQLKGKYDWIEETDSRPGVDLGGRIKFPTASDDKGLGTGRFDVGFGPEFLKRFGSLITFGDLQLVFRDRPSGSTIKSTRLDYSVGVGYPLTERFTGYASLEGGTKSSSGSEVPLELVFSGGYKATDRLRVNGFLLAGLTDGSPDFGGGTSVTVSF